VQKGIQEWVIGWQRRQWRTAAGQAVKNQDLWQSLLTEAARHQVHWHWVKAHVGNIHNERVDSLARQAIDEL
jgi:ribonuclease HI